jgi:uncharacterized protein YjiS (DUF1127 family)
MNCPTAETALPVPQTLVAGATPPIGRFWRAVMAAVCRLRSAPRAADRDAPEREALAGLSEHILKDIGASSWLVANAATRARDALDASIDRRMF